jgi:hypothetical protein
VFLILLGISVGCIGINYALARIVRGIDQ